MLSKLKRILHERVTGRTIEGTLVESGHRDRKGNLVRKPVTRSMLEPKRIPRVRGENQETPDVYCQTCERDLTDVEEVVLAEGSVYCQGYEGNIEGRCIDKVLGYGLNLNYIDQDWPSLIRGAIEEGHLTNYGPLKIN